MCDVEQRAKGSPCADCGIARVPMKDHMKEEAQFGIVTCLMAVTTAADKKQYRPAVVPVQPVVVGSGPDSGDGPCRAACTRPKCACDGFGLCVGRKGHLRLVHQCYAEPTNVGRSSNEQVSASGPCAADDGSSAEISRIGPLDEGIPRVFIEDAIFRLRRLRDDDERFEALKRYGHLRDLIADELWESEVPSSTDEAKAQIGSEKPSENETAKQVFYDEESSCAAASSRGRGSYRQKG